jgi:uncharacterized membrane protein YdjX (TVP38/TMEM64 family)
VFELPSELSPLQYFGVMVASMLLGQPLMAPTLLAGQVSPPWMVATVAAAAGVVTAVFDYVVVRRTARIQRLQELQRHRYFERAARYAKVAPFFTTGAFAGLPLPFWMVRIMMPISGYPITRYAVAVAIGRFCRMFVVASFGKAFEIPTRIIVIVWIVGVGLGVLGYALKRFGVLKFGGAPPPPADKP